MPRKKSNAALPRGIRPHKSGGYIVDLCMNGQRRTKTAPTLEEAIIERARLSAALHKEITGRPGKIWTLQTALEKTQALIWSDTGGEKSSIINGQAALAFFGPDAVVSEVTPDRIGDYVESLLDAGNSGATINRKLSALSRILRTAHEQGRLDALPKMPRRREGEHRICFLSEEDEALLFRTIEQCGYAPEMTDVVKCLIYTGFRCGELWRMEARDIDTDRWTVTAWKTKSGRPRTIPIVTTIRPIIERRLALAAGGRLFPGLSNIWLRCRWERVRTAMNRGGDPQFVPHMLRHTCATRLARAGVHMTIIKEWMGHATIQTTVRYAHFAPTDLTNAAEALAGKPPCCE